MLQASSHRLVAAVWGIVWASALRPPWAAGVRSTVTEPEGPATVESGSAEGGRMTPRAWRTCPGGFYPRGRASWTSSVVNSWADTHPFTTTTTSISSRLVCPAQSRGKIFPSPSLAEQILPGRDALCSDPHASVVLLDSSDVLSREFGFQ